MKRSIADIIRRGFENTLANWPLLLIRIAEGVLFLMITVAAVVAAVVPVIVSIGLNKFEPRNPDAMSVMMDLIITHWAVIAYLFILVLVLLIVFVGIHSFVEAGVARVYVEAERATAPVPAPTRDQFRAFTAERWMVGGRRDWWTVFWIYNIAWGVSGVVLLVPLVILGAAMLIARDNAPVMIGVSCLGLALFLPFFIAVAVMTHIWCRKAIVVCVARASDAMESLRTAWREFKADTWRHIGVALALFLLTIVGAMVFASFSGFSNLSDSPGFALALMPMQLVSSFLNTIFSAAMACWFTACFAALTMEPR